MAGGLAVTAVAAAATQLDLEPPDPVDQRSGIDVDEDTGAGEADLEDEEAEELRAQADPDRLRCTPSGCERWRVTLEAANGSPQLATLDDAVVLVDGPGRQEDGASTGDPDQATVLRAIDLHDGATRWERHLDDLPDPGPAGTPRVAGSTDGLLVVAGATVAAFDADGGYRWSWEAGDGGDEPLVTLAEELDAVVVIGLLEDGASADGPEVADDEDPADQLQEHRTLGLDPDSGEVRWELDGAQPMEGDGRLLTNHHDGVRGRNPATGEERWHVEAPQPLRLSHVGSWLAIPSHDGTQVIDPDDGRRVAELDRAVSGTALTIGDLLLAATHDPLGLDGDGQVEEPDRTMDVGVTAFDADGSVVWSTVVAETEVSLSCCTLAHYPDDAHVTLLAPELEAEIDAATGQVETVVEVEPSGDEGFLPPGSRVWHLTEDVFMEDGWAEGPATLFVEDREIEILGRIRTMVAPDHAEVALLLSEHEMLAVDLGR